MEFNSLFLGAEGRTSTSCNHLSNLAKEYYTNLEKQIKNNSFVTQTVEIVGKTGKTTLITGSDNLETLESALKEIGQCKALIAYLREGIKAKDSLLSTIRSYISPEQVEIVQNRPSRGETISNQDIIDSWPLEKRVRYYRLEAFAAVYGKAIHPDGDISIQRNKLRDALSGQAQLQEKAGNLIVFSDEPVADPSKVEDFYFHLQAKYREYQAELNSLKTEIETAVLNHNTQVEVEYESAYAAWDRQNTAITNQVNVLKKEETKRVSQLKIIIPENLQAIVKKIESL